MSAPRASDATPSGASVRSALLVAIVAISFAAIFVRLAAPSHPLLIAGTRLLIAASLLAIPTARAFARGRLPPRVVRFALVSGVLYAIHFGTWVASLTRTSVASSVTLVTATPLVLALISLATKRDRPTRRHLLAMLLALIGLSCIGWADLQLSTDALYGDALAMVGAVAMALYLFVARELGDSLDVLGFSGLTTTIGGVLLIGCALVSGVPMHYASSESFLFIALSALIPQVIGHNLLTWAVRHTTPTAVGIATVGEPVGATILAWFILGDRVGGWVIVGCAVTLLGVILSVGSRARPTARSA